MGREVRLVTKDWEHPRYLGSNEFIPLHGTSFSEALVSWKEHKDKWSEGLRKSSTLPYEWIPLTEEELVMSYTEWDREKPVHGDYMPEWDEKEATYLMMYEDTTEGTPMSPAFKTPEELAQWLFDNEASVFGDMTASYERWLDICNGGCGHLIVRVRESKL